MISPTNNQALNKQTFNLKISDIKFSIISKRYHKKHKSNHSQAIQNKMQHSSSTISRSSNGVSRNSFIPKNNIKCQSHSQIDKGQRFDFTPLDPVQASYLSTLYQYIEFPGRKLKSLKPRSYFQVANENMATVYNRLNEATSLCTDALKACDPVKPVMCMAGIYSHQLCQYTNLLTWDTIYMPTFSRLRTIMYGINI